MKMGLAGIIRQQIIVPASKTANTPSERIMAQRKALAERFHLERQRAWEMVKEFNAVRVATGVALGMEYGRVPLDIEIMQATRSGSLARLKAKCAVVPTDETIAGMLGKSVEEARAELEKCK